MIHKAACQACKQFATFSSRRSIASRDLPPILAINTGVFNDDIYKIWVDNKGQTFLKTTIELRGEINGVDDPDNVVYSLKV